MYLDYEYIYFTIYIKHLWHKNFLRERLLVILFAQFARLTYACQRHNWGILAIRKQTLNFFPLHAPADCSQAPHIYNEGEGEESSGGYKAAVWGRGQ